jgi:hypothetical protein
MVERIRSDARSALAMEDLATVREGGAAR